MAAAPATAAAALALLTNTTGRIVALGFDLGQIVGATGDASCLLVTKNQNGAAPVAVFVSAATASAGAGVLGIARNMRALGITVLRYVISTTDIQAMVGAGPNAAFVSAGIAPTDTEWIDIMAGIMVRDTVDSL